MTKAVLDPQIKKNSSQEELSESPKTMSTKEILATKLRKYMEEESKIVRGRFRSYKNQGAVEKISFKKYPTPQQMRERGSTGGIEPFEKWMRDNEIYEIPLYVARFLNGIDVTAEEINGKANFCSYPIHSFISNGQNLAPSVLDAQGVPIPVTTTQKFERRFGFESLEFGG